MKTNDFSTLDAIKLQHKKVVSLAVLIVKFHHFDMYEWLRGNRLINFIFFPIHKNELEKCMLR